MLLLVLLLAVGSALCQTAGRAANTPSTTPVPILRQVNTVNEDGSYTYGFEAADGTFKLETRDADGQVTGKYGYVDANGKRQEFNYNANKATGFNPSGSLIPQPPAAPAGHQQSSAAAAAPASRRQQQFAQGTLLNGIDIALEGYSEDRDEDGFVDPIPQNLRSGGSVSENLPSAPRQQVNRRRPISTSQVTSPKQFIPQTQQLRPQQQHFQPQQQQFQPQQQQFQPQTQQFQPQQHNFKSQTQQFQPQQQQFQHQTQQFQQQQQQFLPQPQRFQPQQHQQSFGQTGGAGTQRFFQSQNQLSSGQSAGAGTQRRFRPVLGFDTRGVVNGFQPLPANG